MKDLLEQVASRAKDMWHMIGIQLDIEDHVLNTFEDANPLKSYLKVFREWKSKGAPPFTWATILDALRSRTVGANDVAKLVETWLEQNKTQSHDRR